MPPVLMSVTSSPGTTSIALRAGRGGRFLRISRRDHDHSRQGPHHAEVFHAVVRVALGRVREAAAHGNDAHRIAVVANVVANLLQATHGREVGDGVREHRLADFREARCDAGHVLLGHADVEELVRQGVAEPLEHRESEVAGDEHQVLALPRLLEERLDEAGPHGLPLTSSTAFSSCSLLGER
jgi:hypothetical protein